MSHPQQFPSTTTQSTVKNQNNQSDQNDEPVKNKNSQNNQNNDNEIKVQQIKIDEDNLQEQDQKFIQSNPEKANQFKKIGNQLFKSQKYQLALVQYQKALRYTDDKNLKATLYSNIAICYIKDNDYDPVKKYCQKALKQDTNHKKSRMNLARYYQHEKKIEQAYEQYKILQKNKEGLTQSDIQFIRKKLIQLQPKIDQINEKRKKQVVDGLKTIGNSILGIFGMSLDNFQFQKGQNGGYNISMKN